MEVFYPDWLANPILVLKKNNTWRICIDYMILNKACPKDPFTLPCIDKVIVGTPDYPSGIPVMHTTHDPMISMS
jgi:hypothetical protein